MDKSMLGFGLGAVLTSIAFMLFLAASEDVGVPRLAESEARVVESTNPASGDNQQSQRSAATETIGREAPAVRIAEEDESREARLIQQLADAQRIVAEVSRELDELRAAKKLKDDPVLFPLPLSSDFSWVLEVPPGRLLHGLIEREERDEAWAAPMEAELQRFLYGQIDAINELGPPTVNCRSSRCEVTFANSAGDEQSYALAQRLRVDFNQHELRDQFYFAPGSFWVGEHYQNGVVTVFWSLPRRED